MTTARKALLIAIIGVIVILIALYYIAHRAIVVPEIVLKAEWEFRQSETDPNYAFYNASAIEYQAGHLYVCDTNNHRIMKYDETGNFLLQIGSAGQGPGELLSPTSLAVHKDGSIFILDSGNGRVQVFDSLDAYVSSFKVSTGVGPHRLDIDQSKHIFIPSEIGSPSLVTVYALDGKKTLEIGKKITFSISHPSWQRNNDVVLTVDNSGDVYLQFWSHPFLRRYNHEGELVWERDFSRLREFRTWFADARREEKEEPGQYTRGFAGSIESLGQGSLIVDAPQPYLIDRDSKFPKAKLRFFRSDGQEFYRRDIAATPSRKLYVLDWEGNICRFALPPLNVKPKGGERL